MFKSFRNRRKRRQSAPAPIRQLTPETFTRIQASPYRWSPNDVGVWLEFIGMGMYVTNFVQHGVSGTKLIEMDSGGLYEIGVQDLKHLKKIMNRINRIKKGDKRGPLTDSDTESLYDSEDEKEREREEESETEDEKKSERRERRRSLPATLRSESEDAICEGDRKTLTESKKIVRRNSPR